MRSTVTAALFVISAWVLAVTCAVPAQAQQPGDTDRVQTPPMSVGSGFSRIPETQESSHSGRTAERSHSFNISLNAQWLGGSSLGGGAATLTPNQTASQPFTYFNTGGRLGATPGLEARLGYRVTSLIGVEGGFGYSHPNVTVTIAQDFENVPGQSFNAERLSQYLIDGAVLVHLRGLSFSGQRTVPFILAGAAYLRQLHEGNALLETGQVYFAGGGVKHLFALRPGSRLAGLGIRADARVCYRRNGFSFNNPSHVYPAVSGGLFIAF